MRYALVFFIAVFCMSIQGVVATPVLTNATASSLNPWLGESITVSVHCNDTNSSITSVTADITGPIKLLPRQQFSLSGNEYQLVLGSSLLSDPGTYKTVITCTNTHSQSATTPLDFSVSELTAGITRIKANDIISNTSFIGDTIETTVLVRKDQQILKLPDDQVDFTVTLNGNAVSLSQQPGYIPNLGWELKFATPPSPGTYTAEITATYKGRSAKQTTQLTIKDAVILDLMSVNTDLVQEGSTLIINVNAKERDFLIPLTTDNLELSMDSTVFPITDISQSNDKFTITAKAPKKSVGTHTLNVRLSHKGSSFTARETLTYGIDVIGKILDPDGSGTSIGFTFITNTSTYTFRTNSLGEYEGLVDPHVKTITLSHGSVKAEFTGVDIDEFDDPIKLLHFNSLSIPGFNHVGVFVFETVFDYEEATIEMLYNDQNADESKLSIYRCTLWNQAKQACNGPWFKASGEFDIVSNTATIKTPYAEAYAIAGQNTLDVDIKELDGTYPPGATITVSGFTVDNERNPVAGTILLLKNKGETITTTESGNNGIFSFDVTLPDEEGVFKYLVLAEKSPFIPSQEEISIVLEKSKEFTLQIQDLIKMSQGESKTIEFSLVNIGQAALEDISFEIIEISEEHYRLERRGIDSVASGATEKINIHFTLPDSLKPGVYNGQIIARTKNITSKKSFAISVEEKETSTFIKDDAPVQESGQSFFSLFSSPSGFVIAPPGLFSDYSFYIIILMAIIIIYLWRSKVGRSAEQRPEINTIFENIKSEMDEPGNSPKQRRYSITKSRGARTKPLQRSAARKTSSKQIKKTVKRTKPPKRTKGSKTNIKQKGKKRVKRRG